MSTSPLRQLRQERGWSRRRLSRETGISYPELWRYESGLRIPSRNLIKLAGVLGCDPPDLLQTQATGSLCQAARTAPMCPACGEERLIEFDQVLDLWSCAVCSSRWSWAITPSGQLPNTWLGLPEAAAYLGISEASILSLIQKDRLPAYGAGCRLRLRTRDLDEWLRRHQGFRRGVRNA